MKNHTHKIRFVDDVLYNQFRLGPSLLYTLPSSLA